MMTAEPLVDLRRDADDWCRGRLWVWRAPILLYLAYAGVQHARFAYYSSLFSGITFGLHELGHVAFSAFGEFMMFAGGSLAQILAPLVVAALFLRQRDYFGIAVAGAWLAFSMIDLSAYIGDARARELPLLGLTSDPQHDWHYLLSKMGLLAYDTRLAGLARWLGFCVWAASLGLGLWLCWKMARRSRNTMKTAQ